MSYQLPNIPGYHVDRVLSEAGGTGIVYWGIDLRSGFPVAIKQLYAKHANNASLVRSFRQEANNYVYLEHPRITKLVDFVEAQGQCFLVMEFLQGNTLDQLIRKYPNEVKKHAIALQMQLLETLDYIHHVSTPFSPHGMLHLDIKPSNIMVNERWQIKVMDMGISATISEHNTMEHVCGTLHYMPPEQFNREKLGPYTDVFAAGVTFYRMLTSYLPFNGKELTDILVSIEQHHYTPVIAYNPWLPEGIEKIISRALQPQVALRYPNCSEMAADLCRIR